MAGCEEFQVDIEKRLHGALGEAGRAPLEEHLAGCERCRAYEAAARGAEATMGAEAREAATQVDWDRVERGIRGGVAASVRMLAAAVLVAAWMAGMVWLSTPGPLRADRLVRTLPAMGVMLVLVAFVSAYSARRLTALVDRGEMLETWRHLVWANLTWARRMQWATAAIVLFLLYKALYGRPGATFDATVFYGGLALPMAAAWLYLRRVKLPRAEREARDLGIAVGELRR
ncbi:MAG TPA: zf-HC2 domain-containing protein [Anaeromyxobacteraceae bacterium]|nr:zf-HC2 domain-containing protein [Anaeromyxobacteraceae bacterium]